MKRTWTERLAVFAMILGLAALAAISLAALAAAASVFLCVAAILYIVNPAGVRAIVKELSGKPDQWFEKARGWLADFKEILAAFESVAREAAGAAPQNAGAQKPAEDGEMTPAVTEAPSAKQKDA